jgi:molecular chaperone GrpE (heat shock protein)
MKEMMNPPENESGNTAAGSVAEPETSPANQSFTVSEAEWTALKALLDKRYTEIATLLRYNKTKDDSIQKLSAEIQKYREGFAFSALKPFINALISLCEDCRKSIRDAKQFTPDNEKIKKYIDFLVSDFEEMLTNVGLERNGNSISLNGKPLSGLTQPKTPPEAPLSDEQKDIESSQILPGAEQIKSISDLIEGLNKNEAAIRLTLQDRAAADKTIQEYIALAARTDAEHYLALAAPVSRQIYALYDSISARSKSAGDYSDDALIKFYMAILKEIIKGIEIILTNAGVLIETLKDVFDTQKHKLVKTIPTNDEKQDRGIAKIYTNCYSYDGKVIYQSKVDVYKYQNLTQGEQNHG